MGNVETIVGVILLIIVALFGVKIYKFVYNITGIEGTARTAMLGRLIISLASIWGSYYGVNKFIFSLGGDSETIQIISTIIAVVTGMTVALFLESMKIFAEKSIFEAIAYGKAMRIALQTSILVFVIILDYQSLKLTGSVFVDKVYTKNVKYAEDTLTKANNVALRETTEQIDRLKKQLDGVKVDWEAIYKNSKGYSVYTAKIAKEERLANSPKLTELSKQSNKWAKNQIAIHKAKVDSYKKKLEALEVKAKDLAKQKEKAQKEEIENKITSLTSAVLANSKSTIDKLNAEKAKATSLAKEREAIVTKLAYGVEFVSIFLSLIVAYNSGSFSKAMRLAQEERERIMEDEIATELHKEKINQFKDSNGLEQSTDKPNLDQSQTIKDMFAQTIGEEVDQSQTDYNQELYELALTIREGNKHPNRENLKSIAKAHNLDTTLWTEKYRDYVADMQSRGLLEKVGRELRFKEGVDEVA